MEEGEDHSIIRHNFFQKATTSSLVFHGEGAHPWKYKIVTLSEELRGRLLHIDSTQQPEDKAEMFEDYNQMMCDSGYSH